MSKWLRSGTIAVTNGSPNVVGTGTTWLNAVMQGDMVLLPDGNFYEVDADPVDNTHIVIVGNYPGSTLSGQTYAVARFSDGWRPTAELSIRIQDFLASTTDIYSAAGAPDNGLGGDGSAYFRQDLPYLYFKAAGVWGSPINLTGPTGPAGASYDDTSASSNSIGTGSKSFTVTAGKAFAVGTRLRIARTAAPTTTYMEGVVTSYSGTALVITIDLTGGSGGPFTDWTISLAGERGATATYADASATSNSVATGAKTWTVSAGKPFAVGTRLRIARTADPAATYMEGVTTGYTGTTLNITIDRAIGSGTYTDWTISLAGDIGATGATGATGAAGATGGAGPAGQSYDSTSSTSVAIGTGSKSFTVGTGKPYNVGTRLRAAADASNLMDGEVTSYNPSTGALVISADRVEGSGTYADWTISLVGAQGATGNTGATGATGPAGPDYNSTSSSNITPETVSKAFTVAAGLPYVVGQRLRAASSSNTARWMSGLVASYSGTTLTIVVDLVGTELTAATDWVIALSGEKGDQGAAGEISRSGSVTTGDLMQWQSNTLARSASTDPLGARRSILVPSFDAGADLGLITNPFFEISQEKGTTLGSDIGSTGYYPADQWHASEAAATLVMSAQNVADPFSGTSGFRRLTNSAKIIATTALASFGASEVANGFRHRIEGVIFKTLRWGTADARDLDVAMILQASVTGTYCVSIRNSATTRSYVHTFSLTANTPTAIFLTIPGDTSGTWLEDTGIGANLQIGAVSGSTYQAAAVDTWYGANYVSHSSVTNWCATTNAFVQLAYFDCFPKGILPFSSSSDVAGEGLQLLLNMRRPYDRELARCQRYWLRAIVRNYSTNTYIGGSWTYPSGYMRVAPAVTYADSAGNASKISTSAGGDNISITAGGFTGAPDYFYADAIIASSAGNWWFAALTLNARM